MVIWTSVKQNLFVSCLIIFTSNCNFTNFLVVYLRHLDQYYLHTQLSINPLLPTYTLKYFENKTPLLPGYDSRGEVQGHERFKPNDTFLKVEAVIFQSYTLKNKKLKNFHHDATTFSTVLMLLQSLHLKKSYYQYYHDSCETSQNLVLIRKILQIEDNWILLRLKPTQKHNCNLFSIQILYFPTQPKRPLRGQIHS